MEPRDEDFIKKVRELETDWVMTIVTVNANGNQEHWFGRKDRTDNMTPVKLEASNANQAWKKLIEYVEAAKGLPSQD